MDITNAISENPIAKINPVYDWIAPAIKLIVYLELSSGPYEKNIGDFLLSEKNRGNNRR
mgnify:CR=1 FL=1